MRNTLTIGGLVLALTGCAWTSTEPEAPKPMTMKIYGTLPPDTEETKADKAEEGWKYDVPEPVRCSGTESRDGHYRVNLNNKYAEYVIDGGDCYFRTNFRDVNDSGSYNFEITDEDCDRKLDEVFSVDFIPPHVNADKIKEAGQFEGYNSLLEHGSGYACMGNWITPRIHVQLEEKLEDLRR